MLGGDADQVIPPKHLQGLWAGAQLRPEAGPSERVVRSAPGSENNSAEVVSKEMHRKMDSDGHFMGCLPSATPRKKTPIKGGADILKSLDVMSGDVELRSGKDRYRLFAYGRHGVSANFCHLANFGLISNQKILAEIENIGPPSATFSTKSLAHVRPPNSLVTMPRPFSLGQ